LKRSFRPRFVKPVQRQMLIWLTATLPSQLLPVSVKSSVSAVVLSTAQQLLLNLTLRRPCLALTVQLRRPKLVLVALNV
jgi:hypothetical protein